MAYDGPIIDAHMHLWDLSRHHYEWLQLPPRHNPAGDLTPIAGRNYGLDDYLADVAGLAVVKSVHVECGLPPRDQVSETDWLQAIADARGYPHGIVAGACLDEPGVEGLLEAQAARPGVRGVRHIVNWHQDPLKTYTSKDLLESAAWRSGFARLARLGLSFDLQLYPSQMPAAAALAADHPQTLLIVNHAGMPTDRDPQGLAAWKAGLALLAERPNVAIKISNFGGVDRCWTPLSIQPFVETIFETFGVERVMFASNFPVDRVHGRFAEHVAALDQATSRLCDGEREAFFAANAARLYRL